MFLFSAYKFISSQPVAIVLPHHNLVQSTRQKFLQEISRRRFLTSHIILIGPDHFSSNQNQITTSNTDWKLSTGTVKHSQLINLPVDNSLLQNDHAIFNPLADIKTYFPEADVQPILIGQKLTANNLQSLLKSINSVCQLDCLLIASVDFSHYLPASLADVHDAFTLAQLNNQDVEKIISSEVDSPQSLFLLINFTSNRNAFKWHLFAHTNSGIIAHNPDVETTSHVFGFFAKGQIIPDNTITTLHLPRQISRKDNQSTLGDRFFYGVDRIFVDSQYQNIVTASIDTPHQITKILLPLDNNLFLRGPNKQFIIKNIFDSITTSTVTKDYFWGKLLYEN